MAKPALLGQVKERVAQQNCFTRFYSALIRRRWRLPGHYSYKCSEPIRQSGERLCD